MNYKGDINTLIERYVLFVDEISDKNHYEKNIRHLLYLIVPAFVLKYGVNNENTVKNCFKDVPIIITGTEDKFITASFNRRLKRDMNGYKSIKTIHLNKYKTSSTISELLDSIIHEYNHALNSYNNEILYDDTYVKLRTGLSFLIYDKKNLSFIKKSSEVYLEEIINTEQTEDIINIINSLNKYDIDNEEFKTTLYTLDKEIKNKYESDAYSFDSYICNELMNNKTFTSTINNLRFKGFVEDIPTLFDDVIGKDGAYKYLNELLTSIHELEIKYMKSVFFKKRLLNKLRSKSKEVVNLIKEYDEKCIFK